MRENQTKVDRLLESVASGEVSGPLLSMLLPKRANCNVSRNASKQRSAGLRKR